MAKKTPKTKKQAVRKRAVKKAAGDRVAGKTPPAGSSAELPEAGLPGGYPEFLDALRHRVHQSQTRAALSVNRELIQLYWEIGREIVIRQEREGWGRKVLERLADDLQKAFPGLRGFSRSNVFRMRAFFQAWQAAAIVAQPVRQFPGQAGAENQRMADAAQDARDQSDDEKVAQPVRELPVSPQTPLLQAVTNLPQAVPDSASSPSQSQSSPPKQKQKSAQKKQTQKSASPRPQATAKSRANRSKG